jgi:hypothetical protein
MEVKKFIQYIKENNTVTETDIREYIREEWNIAKDNIFVKVGAQFPLDNNDIAKDKLTKVDDLVNQLIDLYTNITIDNISNFNKTWETSEDKIEEGDTVIDKESGEEFFVSRFGANNNFFDNEKSRFISLDSVKKKK